MSRSSTPTIAADRLAASLIAAFMLVNLFGLDRLPIAQEVESWIAEPGLRFWERGWLVSELMQGFFGTERRFLLHAPYFTLLTGGVAWLFGPGLFQVRLVSLTMAAVTAALTYRLGRTLLSPRRGLLAVLVLMLFHIRPAAPYRPAGIVLVDLGRLARYDIAVPMFGLMGFLVALHWLLTPEAARPPRARLLLAGACTGLAMGCHPLGLTWIVTLCVACVVTRGARGERAHATCAAIGWIAAGAGLALLPWLAFLSTGWNDFVAQQRMVSERYDALHVSFYARNVLEEWQRYGAIGRGLLTPLPGAWLFAAGIASGAVVLVFDARRHDVRLRLLRAGLTTGLLLLAIGVQPKYEFYAATLWPWIALTAAAGLDVMFEASSRVVRVGTLALTVLACADGLATGVRYARLAWVTTPYPALCARLAALLPPDATLVALPPYWLGLAPHVRSYQSLRVPLLLASRNSR